MGMELHRRMEEVAANPDVRAVILRGNGRAFCAGVDLKPDVRERIVGRSPAEKVLSYYHRYRGSHRRTRFIEETPQPIIVAMHGYCLGAGFEIAMLGDIRIAAEGTVFGCPEAGIGVPIDCGLDMRLAAGGRTGVGEVDHAHRTPHRRRQSARSASCRRSSRPTSCSPRHAARRRDRCQRADRGAGDQAYHRHVGRARPRRRAAFEAMNAAVGFVSDDLIEGFAAGREKRLPRFEGK